MRIKVGKKSGLRLGVSNLRILTLVVVAVLISSGLWYIYGLKTAPKDMRTTTPESTSSSSITSPSSSLSSTLAATGTTAETSSSVSFDIANASGAYDSTTGETNITVVIIDTGAISLTPGPFKGTAPNGTTIVGKVDLKFYAANGTEVFVCGCGMPPDTANGGKIIVSFLVTGAARGDDLTLAYAFRQSGQFLGPVTASFIVN